MNDLALDVQAVVSAEEWQRRIDLAACYRLVAMYGWDDLIFTHISARVPGMEHQFLINPYGMMFDEITASSLVKVDMQGRKYSPVSTTSIPQDLPYMAPSTQPGTTLRALSIRTALTAPPCPLKLAVFFRCHRNRCLFSPPLRTTTTKAWR